MKNQTRQVVDKGVLGDMGDASILEEYLEETNDFFCYVGEAVFGQVCDI